MATKASRRILSPSADKLPSSDSIEQSLCLDYKIQTNAQQCEICSTPVRDASGTHTKTCAVRSNARRNSGRTSISSLGNKGSSSRNYQKCFVDRGPNPPKTFSRMKIHRSLRETLQMSLLNSAEFLKRRVGVEELSDVQMPKRLIQKERRARALVLSEGWFGNNFLLESSALKVLSIERGPALKNVMQTCTVNSDHLKAASITDEIKGCTKLLRIWNNSASDLLSHLART